MRDAHKHFSSSFCVFGFFNFPAQTMGMVPGACEMNQNNDSGSGSSNTTGKYAAKMHVDP